MIPIIIFSENAAFFFVNLSATKTSTIPHLAKNEVHMTPQWYEKFPVQLDHTFHKEVSPLGNWINQKPCKKTSTTNTQKSILLAETGGCVFFCFEQIASSLFESSRWNVNPGSGPPFGRSVFFEGIINFSWLWEWNNEMNLNKTQTKIHQMLSRTGNQWVWAGPCFWNKHHSLWQSSHSREHTS